MRVPALVAAVDRFESEWTGDGFVTLETYTARLEQCESCQFRVNTTCNVRGCNIVARAASATWRCPNPEGSRWPDQGTAS